ncbi:hypothetical protein V6N13_015820 [Hibiscus sabdariffa]
MEGNCWKPTEPMGLSHPLQEQGFYQLVSIQNPFAFFQQHGMWEGPNFYPVPASPDDSLVKHVLKVSMEKTNHDIYTIGSYDYVKDIFTPE